jgi:outer membrane protein assembly factor BamD
MMFTKTKLIPTLAVLLLLTGCASRQYQVLPDARSQYDFAMMKYQAGKYDDSILEFQKVLFSYPGQNFIDSVQYWFAMSYYGRDDYHLGVAEFRRLINSFPNSDLIDDAQLMIGRSYLDAAPRNSGLDQTDTESAIKELTAFIEDYPTSNRLAEGQEILSLAIERIATKQFNAGKQYFRMGNRASSRIYLEDLIKEYPESKTIPEALFLLASIDEREAKYADARDKLRNLISAFPDSKFSRKAEEFKAKIEEKLAAGADLANDTTKVIGNDGN